MVYFLGKVDDKYLCSDTDDFLYYYLTLEQVYQALKITSITGIVQKDDNLCFKSTEPIGVIRTSSKGQKMMVIKYKGDKDIDVLFEDGTIVYKRRYSHFKEGLIANPNAMRGKRIGEESVSTLGQKMTIIDYRGIKDIDVKFEDGTIVKNKSYISFQRGNIINPNYTMKIKRVGEQAKAINGQKMTIIDYRNEKDIDIQFEDGTVVYNKRYDCFKAGKINNPNVRHPGFKDRTKECNIAVNGQKMTIIRYGSKRDIDVQFEDGTIVKNKTYDSFKSGKIGNFSIGDARKYKRAKERMGKTSIASTGEVMKIVAYRTSLDIDVQFEDGTIVHNKKYDNFLSGQINNPNTDAALLSNNKTRVGETSISTLGEKMKIIEYRGSGDIDIQFEDGTIVCNKGYWSFSKGYISNPNNPDNSSRSLPEKIVAYFIGKYFNYIPSYKPDWLLDNKVSSKNYKAEIDIFIPSIKVGIEYDGFAWHTAERDNRKNQSIVENRDYIKKLIRIREDGCSMLESQDDMICNVSSVPYHRDNYSNLILGQAIKEVLNHLGIIDCEVVINDEIVNYCRSKQFLEDEKKMLET